MRVFVIWDLASPAVHTLLEALPELCPQHDGRPITWCIPSATAGGGQLARDVIARGLRDADHVIALLDRPSASVGWQVGLAIGWQRSLQLAFLGAALPPWTQVGVLKGLFAHHLNDVTGIGQLLKLQPWEMPPIPPAQDSASYLILCPSGPVGSTLCAVAKKDPRAQTLPEDGWGLYELPALLAGCGRLVWVLASDPHEGADNAASGVVAGFAEASGLPVAVLRAQELPPVVDVQPRELRFHGLAEFKHKLQLATVGDKAPLPRASGLPPVAATGLSPPAAGVGQRAGRRNGRLALPLGVVAAVALGGGAHWWLRQPQPVPKSVPAAAVPIAAPADSKGTTVGTAALPDSHAVKPAARGNPERRHAGGSGRLTQRAPGAIPQTPIGSLVQLDSAMAQAPPWEDSAATDQRAAPPPGDSAPVTPPSLQPQPASSAAGQPMDSQHFSTLLTRLHKVVYSEARLGLVRDAISDGRWFSCAQIAQVMKGVVSSSQQIDLAVTMYARVTDPQNTTEVIAVLFHESDRNQLRGLLRRP